jgi:hypothetical protein
VYPERIGNDAGTGSAGNGNGKGNSKGGSTMKSFLSVFLMLVTVSTYGCSAGGGSDAPIVVKVSPVAVVTPSAGSAIAGYTTIELSGEGSSDPDGTIVSYSWDTDGDGVADRSGPRITVSFPEVGDHAVALTVTDSDGLTASASATVTMMPDTRTPPTAVINSSDVYIHPGTGFSLSGSGSDADGTVVSYEWKTDTGCTHAGTAYPLTWAVYHGACFDPKVITFTATDNDGFKGSASINVYVVENQPPDATIDPTGIVQYGAAIMLTANGSDPDGSVVSYSWDYNDDGDVDVDAIGKSVMLLSTYFPGAGYWNMVLTIKDDDGVNTNIPFVVRVATPPNVSVAPVKNSSGVVDQLTILASSTDGCAIDTSTVRVDLGDGSAPQYAKYMGTADNVATFSVTGLTTTEGSYTASIQVRDTEGLSTSLSAQYAILYPAITIHAAGIPAGTGVEPHNVPAGLSGYLQTTITGSVDTVPASPIAFTHNKNSSYVIFKSDDHTAGKGYHLNFTNYVGVCTSSTPGSDKLEIWSYGTTTSYEGTLDHDVVIDLNYSYWGAYTGYGMCSY